MKSTIRQLLILLLIAFVSCGKDPVKLPEKPKEIKDGFTFNPETIDADK